MVRGLRFFFFAVFAVVILGGAAGAGVLVGVMSVHTDAFPFSTIEATATTTLRYARKTALRMRMVQGDAVRVSEGLQYPSTFVLLQGASYDFPPLRRGGVGGGLTSIGDYVVLLTHDGRVFAAMLNGEIAPIDVAPPENGYDDYVTASRRPPYDAYQHNYAWFRYNDIAYFENDSGSGLVVAYTEFHDEDECYTTTVSRTAFPGPVSDPRELSVGPDDWEDIFVSSPCLPLKPMMRALEGHMAGSRMVVDESGESVYLASGEYHWDGVYGPLSPDPEVTTALAQDPNTDYGKVISIDLATGESRRLTRGQRNMQGIALDRNGDLWTVEHGPHGGDELNRIVPGANYGWPLETYGTGYDGLPWPGAVSLGRHANYRRPIYAWLPSIAVSGLTRIEGFHEAWDGDFLASSLAGRKLVRVRIAEGRAVFTEDIEVGERIRYVHQRPGGPIVLWTDSSRLIFLTPHEGGLGAAWVERYVKESLDAPASVKTSLTSQLRACMECHSFNRSDSRNAPSLASVLGSRVGSTSFAGYSEALSSSARDWNRELLDAYLDDPQSVFPGSIMPDPQLSDAKVRAAMVDVLEAISTSIE